MAYPAGRSVLADIEDRLHDHDPAYVARIEAMAEVLLPPAVPVRPPRRRRPARLQSRPQPPPAHPPPPPKTGRSRRRAAPAPVRGAGLWGVLWSLRLIIGFYAGALLLLAVTTDAVAIRVTCLVIAAAATGATVYVPVRARIAHRRKQKEPR